MLLTAASIAAWIACAETPPLLTPHDGASLLGAAVAAHSLAEPIAAVEAQLRRAAARAQTERMLPCVRALFVDPWSLPEVAQSMVGAGAAPRPGLAAARLASVAFGAESPSEEGGGVQGAPSAYHAMFHLDYLARGGNQRVHEALAPLLPAEDPNHRPDDAEAAALATRWAELRADAVRLLSISERTPMPADADLECAKRLAAAASAIEPGALAHAVALADVRFESRCDWSAQEAETLPAELAGAVEGTILGAERLEPIGWCVIGGTGANRYDMGRVAAVLDTGGDDRYEWPERTEWAPPSLDPERGVSVHAAIMANACVIVDLAGNDTYVSRGPVGPGGALMGFSYLRDAAGNDRYEGITLSSGAAMLGVAILIDDDGDDVHLARAWSEGAGFYGAGLLVDGGGSDSYEGAVLCQGVGGPRGMGALVDRAGNDRYAVHGSPSAYGTPATDRAFSQGVGYGLRREMPGGVGLLVDDAGDDRYESGEFSQGGAYFFALGVLADHAGDDLYRGDRYAQGFAAHQAFGALLEAGGNDLYYSRTAAGQGAAWDESAAVLIDREGNDAYRADGLSQGAAAQQALAALVDLGGADSFDARGASVQGGGGGAEYHFKECDCYSLGVMIKIGGPPPRLNGRTVGLGGGGAAAPAEGPGETVVSSSIRPDDPRASTAFGLRIIRDAVAADRPK